MREPINDGLEIGWVLVGQHLAPVFQRIGGVDPNDLPPLFAHLVEAARLAASGGYEHTRGVCLGGAKDPPLEDVFVMRAISELSRQTPSARMTKSAGSKTCWRERNAYTSRNLRGYVRPRDPAGDCPTL